MTTFILHGGATSIPCENNINFFKSAAHENSSTVKLLCLYPHYPREKIDNIHSKRTTE
ncbi:hypothetical protein KC717_00810 [Candidatus Dojkabacteria bacterium]|uniref:Uncharacterized protein n=1 Tax=Candidatus Dojkabacteria bacterium TaxID=2099670 RepID=A0A955L7W1_9BACT|nr:hypothetical protein [Candidatus Dojkabacteria bacterium]